MNSEKNWTMWSIPYQYCFVDIFVGLYQRETSHHEISSNGGHQRGTKERQRSRNEEACPQIHADSKCNVRVQTLLVKCWLDDMLLCYLVAFKKFDIIWTLIWNIYTNMHSLKYFFKYYHSVFANNCFNIILSWLGYRSTYSSKLQNISRYYDSIHFQYERLCYGW